VLNFADEPRAVSLPEAVDSTDLVTDSPLRTRYTDTESYVLVADVVVCRPAA